VARLTFGAVTSVLTPNLVLVEQVSFNDQDIRAICQASVSPTHHGKGKGIGKGYLAVPSDINGKALMMYVVHENRELNPCVRNVARRLAKQGFIALVPDASFPLGGYLGIDDDSRAMKRF
jgi:carboxymethylenebutenolidase